MQVKNGRPCPHHHNLHFYTVCTCGNEWCSVIFKVCPRCHGAAPDNRVELPRLVDPPAVSKTLRELRYREPFRIPGDVIAWTIGAALVVWFIVWAITSDSEEWTRFRDANSCKIVAYMEGETFSTISSEGKPAFGVTSPKAGWLCKDGVTYWNTHLE